MNASGGSFSKRRAVLKLLASTALSLVVPISADALLTKASCYQFQSSQTPNTTVEPGVRVETWCYQEMDVPRGATLVFNVDENEIRPELTALVEEDGTLTHGSLLNGKVTLHKLKADFNPLPVPLSPPDDQDEVVLRNRIGMEASFESTVKFFRTQPVSIEDISITDMKTSATAAVLPFRGYWWPYRSGRMHDGSESPLAKFDRFVKARVGYNPGAQLWEKDNHNYEGVDWEGHCNGWAASSILREEPRSSIRDRVSGVTFFVSDLKGLLAEKDNCVKYSFFGRRNSGRSSDDPWDIYAPEFHKVITYYIGRLRKPVLIDYMRSRAVNNHVVSGYTMNMTRNGSVYTVTTTLKIHKYDNGKSSSIGTAPTYNKTYKYKLWVDRNGKITQGQWLSYNPDFLWVPLSPSDCPPTNPRVTEAWIREVFNSH